MAPILNRRDFLFYGGATLAGVTLGEAGRKLLARADERSTGSRPPAEEAWAVSVCRECPAACGVRVRLLDRVPVKLEGNPLCPIARGRLCAKGQAALEAYFDPDRLVGPARRSGARGSNQWTRITWAEAVAEFAARLDRARTDGAILAIGAGDRGPIDDACTRFWRAVPAQVAWTRPLTAERLAPRLTALTGARGDPIFDLEHATHVLSFGAPIVEHWVSPVWAQRSFGRFRRGAGRPRGRLVQVDGRRSLTARKADEWLSVALDRQPSLAYGIASVLLREDRVDRTALAALGGNLGDFENEVVARYTPDHVALASGVPVVTLLRLARELAATPQPLVVVGADAPAELVDAVFALNALVGAFDRPGGVGEAPGGSADRERDDAMQALASLGRSATPSSVVVLNDAGPLRTLASPPDVVGALERCGFIVSLSPYLDETTAAADLLLPTHTPLESWHGVTPPVSDGAPTFACAAPAATSRLETRDVLAILRSTAEQLKLELPSAAPFASSEDAVLAELAHLWTLRRGVPYATPFETNWALQLERGGWWVPPASSREDFVSVALAAGGWVDPFIGVGRLRETILTRGGLTFVPPAASSGLSRAEEAMTAGVVTASIETAVGEARTPSEWPLRLSAFTPGTMPVRGSLNQPGLFELLGQPEGAPWQVWAEIGPGTARAFGIRHGDRIRITSAFDSIAAVAVVVERAPAGTIAIAFVPAPPAGGRWARLVSADVRRLWGPRERTESIGVRVAQA